MLELYLVTNPTVPSLLEACVRPQATAHQPATPHSLQARTVMSFAGAAAPVGAVQAAVLASTATADGPAPRSAISLRDCRRGILRADMEAAGALGQEGRGAAGLMVRSDACRTGPGLR